VFHAFWRHYLSQQDTVSKLEHALSVPIRICKSR